MNWKLLTDAEFEKLALDYARYKYEDYNWQPTKAKGDDNHDFYYIENDEFDQEWEGWGEAKHSNNIDKIMSREKWDQTIISGQLANNVKHLMFVTNARIPINYVLRAECLKVPPYEKFEYINNSILENWMFHNPQYIPKKLRDTFDYIPEKIVPKLRVKFYIIDYFSEKRNILNSPKILYANKNYLLFLLIETNYKTKIKIKLSPIHLAEIIPYDIFTFDDIDVEIGLSCLKCIIRFQKTGEQTLILDTLDEYSQVNKQTKQTFVINDNFEPTLVFDQQINLLEELLNKLSKPNCNNQLFTLYAPKGVGKTYLLKLLYKEYKLYNQLSFSSFSYNESDCAKIICSIFLIANFGIDYFEEEYWKKITELYSNFSEEKKKLSVQDLQNIYNGATLEDTTASILGYEIVKKHILKNGFTIFYMGFKKYITFIFDDIHKLPEEQGKILAIFIKEFCTLSSNSKILLATRKYEIKNKILEENINTYSNTPYYLSAPTITEKITSLQNNFPFISNVTYYFSIVKKCHSTMLFCILLKKIAQFVSQIGEKEADLQIKISEIYNQSIQDDVTIDFQEFHFYQKDFPIIFLVYAYGTKINLEFFKEIGLLEKIYKLIHVGIFQEQGNYISAAHDVYVDVFNKIKVSDLYKAEKEDAANILYNHLENKYIDKVRALSVLLLLNPQYDNRCLEESVEIIKKYYESTEYGKMNFLCEQVIQKKYPIINNNIWNYEKLWLLYLYADCLDHCGSLQKSITYFELICDNGFPIMEDDTLDFLWDAKAQIFHLKFALFKTKGLSQEINIFLKNTYYKIVMKHTSKLEAAYLNALNRRMVLALLLDDYQNSKIIAKSYWNLSNGLKNKSHIAYCFIDYARGIYHCNPHMALTLMQEAYERFSKIDYEKRRLIDSESEIYFLKCLLENDTMEKLDTCSKRILDNGYKNMYLHTVLKRSALRLYRGEILIAQNLLQKITDLIELEQFPRVQLLFCNLMSAIHFVQKDYTTMKRYIQIQNALAQTIGDSYKNSCDWENVKYIDFNFHEGQNYFPIETRLW